MPRRIDALTARDLIAKGQCVVDVLPQSVYSQEHLPTAISLPLERLDAAAALQALGDDHDQPLIVVCFDQH